MRAERVPHGRLLHRARVRDRQAVVGGVLAVAEPVDAELTGHLAGERAGPGRHGDRRGDARRGRRTCLRPSAWRCWAPRRAGRGTAAAALRSRARSRRPWVLVACCEILPEAGNTRGGSRARGTHERELPRSRVSYQAAHGAPNLAAAQPGKMGGRDAPATPAEDRRRAVDRVEHRRSARRPGWLVEDLLDQPSSPGYALASSVRGDGAGARHAHGAGRRRSSTSCGGGSWAFAILEVGTATVFVLTALVRTVPMERRRGPGGCSPG